MELKKEEFRKKNFLEIWLKNWNQFLRPSEAFTAKNYGQYIKEKVAKVNQIQIRIKKHTFKQQSNVTFQLLFKSHDGSLDLDVKFLWNFNLLLYICHNLILASATAGLIAKLDKSVSVHYFTQLQVPLALHWSRHVYMFWMRCQTLILSILGRPLDQETKTRQKRIWRKDQYLRGKYKRSRECSSSDGEAHKVILKTRQNFYLGKIIECPKSNQ